MVNYTNCIVGRDFGLMGPSAKLTHLVVVVLCTLGLVGNSVGALVILHQIHKNGVKVRYYFLLLGLSVSDNLLLLLSLLNAFDAMEWMIINLEVEVSPAGFVWDWISTCGTMYYTLAISLERCWAVCYPLQARRHTNFSLQFAVCVLLFVLTLTLVSFFYYFYWDCESFEIYTAVVLHFIPFAAVVVTNLVTYLGFRKSQQVRGHLSESEIDEIRVTRMLLTVVLVFGICYSFEFGRRLLTFGGYFDYDNFDYFDYRINQLADIFYTLNSSVNFIIYCAMGSTFREHFLQLFGKFKK